MSASTSPLNVLSMDRSHAPAVEAHGLVKVFGEGPTAVRALDGVDFVLEPGAFVAVMGPSGSGKSTLLHILGALDSPTEGTVAVGGRRYEGLDERELTRLRRDHIGFIFQFFNLLPSLSAVENVYLPALISGRRGAKHERRAEELLARVGLGGRAEHRPAELSGGEQQRVSIARALLLSPELLLADEPTGNLDSRAGAEVLGLLRETNRTDGQAIVMVTHDPAAAAVADQVIFLRDGLRAGEVPGGSMERIAEYFAGLRAAPPPVSATA
jgi:putative ABC transport system ATP-binding protein